MSYPVRVVVKEAISQTVESKDSVNIKLGPDPVRSGPKARPKVRERLIEGGWKKSPDGDIFTKEIEPGVTAIWDLDKDEITVVAAKQEEIEVEVHMEARGDLDEVSRRGLSREEYEEELRQRAQKEVEKKLKEKGKREAAAKEEEMLTGVQELIERAVQQVQEEVKAVEKDVYERWITEQANGLGQVIARNESDDGETYTLTIRIDAG